MFHVKQLDALARHSQEMGIDVSPSQAAAMVEIIRRMAAEPQNLSSRDAMANAVDVHLADSLSGLALPEIRDATGIADLGSGGGFPGLVLAIMLPQIPVTLVESEGRKADWLSRVAADFPNVRVVADRSESLARDERGTQPVVTARALGPLPVVMELAAPLLTDGGSLVVWRGRRDTVSDPAAIAAGAVLGLIHTGDVDAHSITAASRYFSVWRKMGITPERFPRRPGMAAKRPLS